MYQILVILAALAVSTVSGIFPFHLAKTHKTTKNDAKRSFGFGDGVFLKDGKPFRIFSGSVHYFRIVPERWEYVLRMCKDAGLNTVQTYVPWNLHQPYGIGEMDFSGRLDLKAFMRLAQSLNLSVLLRVGPYNDAELDFGGLPTWLITEDVKIRTNDPLYLHHVKIWVTALGKMLRNFLYVNGGPILMVQVENEYGGVGCDSSYIRNMENIFKLVFPEAILYTCDPLTVVRCGNGNGTTSMLATVNFGPFEPRIDEGLKELEKYQPKRPILVSEFYTGWFSMYGKKRARTPTSIFKLCLDYLMRHGLSFNLYMFIGGTNFGFMGGSIPPHQKIITSYDYDAPLEESGKPNDKYYAIKDAIVRPNSPQLYALPYNVKPPKFISYGSASVEYVESVMKFMAFLEKEPKFIADSDYGLEYLSQYQVFTLYSTTLPATNASTMLLLEHVNDEAIVILANRQVMMSSRQKQTEGVIERVSPGELLNILHFSYGHAAWTANNDYKSLGKVYFGRQQISNWTITRLDLNKVPRILSTFLSNNIDGNPKSGLPAVAVVKFFVREIGDTYLDLRPCFQTGYVYLNEIHNLGYYNILIPPQITLYIPAEFLKFGHNVLTIFEYYGFLPQEGECKVRLLDHPLWYD